MLKLKGLTKQEAEEEAKSLLVCLQLLDKKNQYGNQLSGGMKRKLCLAISLVGGSKVKYICFLLSNLFCLVLLLTKLQFTYVSYCLN